MKQIIDLEKTGMYEEIIPKKKQKVKDLLKQMKLSEEMTFGVLVNNKKASMEQEITPEDKVIILPHIKGG